MPKEKTKAQQKSSDCNELPWFFLHFGLLLFFRYGGSAASIAASAGLDYTPDEAVGAKKAIAKNYPQ